MVGGATPRQLLVGWANEQDAWVRHIAANVLAAKQPLSKDEIAAAYEEFLLEKGLKAGEAPGVPLLEDLDETAQSEERLEIASLSQIEGVNALAVGQSIEFDPGLTILFGENGSGKTGYARILKRMAAVRTAEEILPDVNASQTPVGPTATVSYKVGTVKDDVRWQNEAGLAPFTRMSVFDAPCVTIHVDSELNYVYVPVELALFSHIQEAVRGVQQLVEEEATALRPTGNHFPPRFTRGSAIYPLIETLGAATDSAQLEALGSLADEDLARHGELEVEISALKGSGVAAQHTAAKEMESRLGRLVDFVELLSNFNVEAYSTALEALERNREARRKARDELFAQDELAGPADDEWQEFVSQAEHYREHLGLDPYPVAGAKCLYCRQPLGDAAAALVQRYRNFIDDTLASQVAASERAAQGLILKPESVSLAVVRNDLAALQNLDHVPTYVTETLTLLDQAETTIAATTKLVPLLFNNIASVASALRTVVTDARKKAAEAARSLGEQQLNSAEALRVRQLEFLELDARKSLSQILPQVVSHVRAAKRADQLSGLVKGLSQPVLRRLTELSKIASEDLVNRDFERLFKEECVQLRAPDVGLEFQGRRGKAERKKAVARYKPSAILSEGEQKVLALADFLAEGRMGTANAPIIFDDPVTSLDYKRMGEVASRICVLADTHQVVVLTHNIMFASTLLGIRGGGKKHRAKFYEIRDDGPTKGIVGLASEPRSDTPADFEKKINVLLEKTRKADETVVRDALLGGAYGLLRSWCEAFVEQEMLQSVSQRYRVNIMMNGLAKIRADRLAAATAGLTPIFDRCSRFMPGHSQPTEQLNVQPNLSEFEGDFAAAKEIRTQYLAD